jgi:hypothetical protein
MSQHICSTDLHILWNMQWRSRTGQGPRQYGWVKSRWQREGGPALCCTAHRPVPRGTRYTASSQSQQQPVPQIHSRVMGIEKMWSERSCVWLTIVMGVTQKFTSPETYKILFPWPYALRYVVTYYRNPELSLCYSRLHMELDWQAGEEDRILIEKLPGKWSLETFI